MRSRLEAIPNDSSRSFGDRIDVSGRFVCAWANEAIAQMGRIDCRGLPARNPAIERRLFVALRHSGEAWSTPPAGNGFVERPLCLFARGRARVRNRVPRILLRADF